MSTKFLFLLGGGGCCYFFFAGGDGDANFIFMGVVFPRKRGFAINRDALGI